MLHATLLPRFHHVGLLLLGVACATNTTTTSRADVKLPASSPWSLLRVGSNPLTYPSCGFAIAGEDKKFVWADARIVGEDKVEIWSDQMPDPVAVRYGWADNPVCNLYAKNGLPVTPFRTDDWPGVTANNVK